MRTLWGAVVVAVSLSGCFPEPSPYGEARQVTADQRERFGRDDVPREDLSGPSVISAFGAAGDGDRSGQ